MEYIASTGYTALRVDDPDRLDSQGGPCEWEIVLQWMLVRATQSPNDTQNITVHGGRSALRWGPRVRRGMDAGAGEHEREIIWLIDRPPSRPSSQVRLHSPSASDCPARPKIDADLFHSTPSRTYTPKTGQQHPPPRGPRPQQRRDRKLRGLPPLLGAAPGAAAEAEA